MTAPVQVLDTLALLQDTGVWGPIIDPLQNIGFAMIPLGLAVVIMLKMLFSGNEGLEAASSNTLRSVVTGGLIVVLAPVIFAMVVGWMPGPGEVVGVSGGSEQVAQKDPSEMNCEELIEYYRPDKEKKAIEEARKNPPEGKTPDEAAESVRKLWDTANRKRCGNNPSLPGTDGGKWVDNGAGDRDVT